MSLKFSLCYEYQAAPSIQFEFACIEYKQKLHSNFQELFSFIRLGPARMSLWMTALAVSKCSSMPPFVLNVLYFLRKSIINNAA